MRIQRIGAACLCLAVLAGACKKKEEAPAGTVPAPGPVTTTAPATPAAVAVTAVNLGRGVTPGKTVTSETTQFGRNDTIYASVATTGAGNGTLTARWTYQDGQVVDESTQSISPTGPAATEFHISKPSGWPAGKYTVAVMLNGVPGQQKEFTVQ